MDKHHLSERDICTKFITPALEQAGWDIATQVREAFPLTKGRIIVRGKLHTRAQNKRADYVLFHKPNMPIAVIEAKDNKHSLGDGMQQGLCYAEMLQVPGLDAFFTVDTERTDGFIKFISDGQKTTFAQDVVPTLDAAHFSVFRPLFDFIKSKCAGGAPA